ncbi:acetoacetate decarboxylase family protein [Nocardia gamkensis]|uniref:acetoacetate decarboxylase family protein n=1 Tax=Nocardia gamkensis TaxID=352869 RepID=UPI0036EAD302
MPVVFGPSELPRVSHWGYVRNISIDFVTDYEFIRPFVPSRLQISREPVVTFCRRSFDDVDYLGGRGYEEMCVGVTVTDPEGDESAGGVFWLALWVNDARAASVGRELTGWPKLGGTFAPVEVDGTRGWRFGLAEYGSVLIDGGVSSAEPLEQDALSRYARECAEGGYAYCLRHFEAIVDGDGFSQLTRTRTVFTPTRAFVGVGSLALTAPDWKAAPHSARIMAALATLPIVRWLPATVSEGSLSIDRGATTALTDQTVPAQRAIGMTE